MALSKEIRRLKAKWESGQGWPKRLQWLEIRGIRGWSGHHLDFDFPIVAIIGENGVGKSTVLQGAASIYESPNARGGKKGYASYFFPNTIWDKIINAEIACAVREGETTISNKTIRKPTDRWRGNPDRRKRDVSYVDLSRIQPVGERVGYQRLANQGFKEASASMFDAARVGRLSQIMGRVYDAARMALTDFDPTRPVPVMSHQGAPYSGFHSGAGETTVAELLRVDPPQYGIVLIDEIESSLHPRSQRRLIRDLAQLCYQRELQIILTTHSPYILEELPLEARVYIHLSKGCRTIINGVSPDFAMTQMDDEAHPECDLYVEDDRAGTMLIEILVAGSRGVVPRCRTIAFGAASVGRALGEMVANGRFPRASCVFLDGDQTATAGCQLLPGGDAPERVVFEGLAGKGWGNVAVRVGRGHAEVADACASALAIADEHQWVNFAANKLTVGGTILWQALCAEWGALCLPEDERRRVCQVVEDVLLPLGSLPPPHPSGLPRDQLSLLPA